MKKVKLVALTGMLASAVLLLASCNNNNTGSASIGVVDVMQVMQSPEVQALGQSMMNKDSGAQAQLKAAYQTLQTANAAVKSAKPADKTGAEAKAKTAQDNFNKLMASFQSEQQNQQNQLRDELTTAIGVVAKAKGISTVYMKQVVLYGQQTDITTDVIAQLKKGV
jgi:Skp family chaperone for outer membrane proteins